MPSNAQIWFALFVAFLFTMAKFGLKSPAKKRPTKKKIGRDKASKMLGATIQKGNKKAA